MNLFRIALISLCFGYLASFTVTALYQEDLARPRQSPHYSGVDPKMSKIVNEYLYLAAQHGLKFDTEVTVGFTNINEGSVIGLCHYGSGFREIDVDSGYWEEATNTSRTALLYHELTHCYCGRDHDFGKDNKYDGVNDSRKEGRFDDNCPLSLMFPRILPDWCTRKHYAQYTEEMFDRCEEY
jgi:hypothetical protein